MQTDSTILSPQREPQGTRDNKLNNPQPEVEAMETARQVQETINMATPAEMLRGQTEHGSEDLVQVPLR